MTPANQYIHLFRELLADGTPRATVALMEAGDCPDGYDDAVIADWEAGEFLQRIEEEHPFAWNVLRDAAQIDALHSKLDQTA
jgi:hypothetical protein